jgi:PPOX class probable F420-dependent enzyme
VNTPAEDALTDRARDWLANQHQAVLITVRSDGSPQSSNISFHFDGDVARISVTADRAKTRNVQRDARVILHVLGESFWQYLSIQATAVASETTIEPGDEVGRELLAVYEAIAGRHPDPEEFFQAMVDQRRLVLTVTPLNATPSNPASSS